mgnify:FL=1
MDKKLQIKYAKMLLLAVVDKKPAERDQLFKEFHSYMKERGLEKLLPAVFKKTLELHMQKENQKGVNLVVANEKDVKKYQQSITEDLVAHFGVKEAEVKIDERVVGGYRLQSFRGQIDCTFRNSLLTLYQNFIS